MDLTGLPNQPNAQQLAEEGVQGKINNLFSTNLLLNVGDFDGDGRSDSIVANVGEDGETPEIKVVPTEALETDGVQTYQNLPGIRITHLWGNSLQTGHIVAQDFDNDGRVDLAFVDTTAPAIEHNGEILKIFGRRDNEPAFPAEIEADLLRGVPQSPIRHVIYQGKEAGNSVGEAIACGDFDDDGFLDLVVGNPRLSNGHTYSGGSYIIWGGEEARAMEAGALIYSQFRDGAIPAEEALRQAEETGSLFNSQMIQLGSDKFRRLGGTEVHGDIENARIPSGLAAIRDAVGGDALVASGSSYGVAQLVPGGNPGRAFILSAALLTAHKGGFVLVSAAEQVRADIRFGRDVSALDDVDGDGKPEAVIVGGDGNGNLYHHLYFSAPPAAAPAE
jgi:hypothetical protein